MNVMTLKRNEQIQVRIDQMMKAAGVIFVFFILLCGVGMMLESGMIAISFADESTQVATDVIGMIMTMIKYSALILSGIFLAMGLLKIIASFSDGNGAEQNKSYMMIATGALLFLFAEFILDSLGLETMIENALTNIA